MKHKKLAVLLTLVMAASVLTISAFAATPSVESDATLPTVSAVDEAGNPVDIVIEALDTSSAAYQALYGATDLTTVVSGLNQAAAVVGTYEIHATGEYTGSLTVTMTLNTSDTMILAHYTNNAWAVVSDKQEGTTMTFTTSDLSPFALLKATSTGAAATTTDTTTTDNTSAGTTSSTGTESPQTGESVSTTAITLAVVFVGLAGLFTVVAYKRRTV